jgi:predicted GIY-YIG superfamily endonuclease
MNGFTLEELVLNRIKIKKEYLLTFEEIICRFDKIFAEFNPTKNFFKINDYFGLGLGQIKARKKLSKDDKINKEWLCDNKTDIRKSGTDFKGLYVFLNESTPFYVGISQGVIKRILQHVKGKSFKNSSLAFKIAKIRYELSEDKIFNGKRDNLDFKKFGRSSKEFLLQQNIALIPINNDEELYLFEVFCSMKLETKLNNFNTN